MHIAQHSMDWGKDFFFNLGMYNNKNENKFQFLFTFYLLSHLFFSLSINLAAPYVTQKCQKELEKLMTYVDFFFANLDEALAFATMKGYTVSYSDEYFCLKLHFHLLLDKRSERNRQTYC